MLCVPFDIKVKQCWQIYKSIIKYLDQYEVPGSYRFLTPFVTPSNKRCRDERSTPKVYLRISQATVKFFFFSNEGISAVFAKYAKHQSSQRNKVWRQEVVEWEWSNRFFTFLGNYGKGYLVGKLREEKNECVTNVVQI